jgi:hypothetical protein
MQQVTREKEQHVVSFVSGWLAAKNLNSLSSSV